MRVEAWQVRIAARAVLYAPAFAFALVGLTLYRLAECAIGVQPGD